MHGHRRNTALDVIRGVALLGILLVNIRGHLAAPVSRIDVISARAIEVLAFNKSQALFSLAFGASLGLQLIASGSRWYPWRRLASLYCIGLAMFVFVDSNPLLMAYAIVGVPLLVLRTHSTKICAVVIGIALMAVAVYPAVTILGRARTVESARVSARPVRPVSTAAMFRTAQEENRQRSYLEWVRMRAAMYWASRSTTSYDWLSLILGLGLCGILIVRKDFLFHPEHLLSRIGAPITFDIVLLVVGVNVFLGVRSESGDDGLARAVWSAISIVAGALQSLVYVLAATIVATRSAGGRFVRGVAAAGRLSLSNFVLQALVLNLVCHGYGLGMEGRIPLAGGFAGALALWLIQLALSSAWLRVFGAGPLERLWRWMATAGIGWRAPVQLESVGNLKT